MKEISEAMLKAFSEIEDVKKTKENPFYKSKYADLDSIVNTIKPVLVKHGLFFRQICHQSDTHAIIETVIHHESGQYLECGPCSVPAKALDPQKYGSALTYARRYSLSAAFSITADDDDDGNNATEQKKEQKLVPTITSKQKYDAFISKLPENLFNFIKGMSDRDKFNFFDEHKWDLVKVIAVLEKEIKDADGGN